MSIISNEHQGPLDPLDLSRDAAVDKMVQRDEDRALPYVAGRMSMTHEQFQRACQEAIEWLGINAPLKVIGPLTEAIRCSRECCEIAGAVSIDMKCEVAALSGYVSSLKHVETQLVNGSSFNLLPKEWGERLSRYVERLQAIIDRQDKWLKGGKAMNPEQQRIAIAEWLAQVAALTKERDEAREQRDRYHNDNLQLRKERDEFHMGLLAREQALKTEEESRVKAMTERDEAIKEANRRDQKWMDGINEIVGRKLDYGDPCSRDNASSALQKFVAMLTKRLDGADQIINKLQKKRDEAQAACAVMREALESLDVRPIQS